MKDFAVERRVARVCALMQLWWSTASRSQHARVLSPPGWEAGTSPWPKESKRELARHIVCLRGLWLFQ